MAIVTLSSQPSYPSFDVDEEGVGVRWTKWVQRLQRNVFAGYGIRNSGQKKALLLCLAGDAVNDIYDSLPISQQDPPATFEQTVDALTEHFNPRQNREYHRYVFRQATQEASESASAFYARLRALSALCEFLEPEDEIKSQLISGAASVKVTKKGLSEPNLTMGELLQFMKTMEISDNQTQRLRNGRSKTHAEDAESHTPAAAEASVNAMHRSGPQRRHKSKPQGTRSQPLQRQHAPQRSTEKCRNCGHAWPHRGGQGNCPARGVSCNNCHKLGHFEKVCQSRGSERRVNTVDQHAEEGQEPVYDYHEYAYSVSSQSSAKSLPYRTVTFNKHPVRVLIDTGSSVDTINENIWHLMDTPNLTPAKETLKPYGPEGNPVPVLGTLDTTVSYGSHNNQTTVHVIKGNAVCLLGHASAVNLGIATINNVTEVPPKYNVDKLEETHPTLFNGIGLLKGCEVTLHIDDAIKPSAFPHRRVPFHLRSKVEEKIKELINLDVIEPAEGPTPWISPIVTPPKPGNPNEIRLCVDMRGPNKAIKRERHVTPTIEDVLSDLNGSAWFSKLDLNQGYHQLQLAPESRYITTFSTHMGLFRYKRLNFGISCAAEIFQNAISNVLSGITGALNVSDDILVYAATREEHDSRLHQVLCRLQEKGLTLNRKKCLIAVQSLAYLGFTFSAAGISPDPEKVRDIRESVPPSNPSEMRSLLGLANYCARFIPNFSTMTAPLRELTRKNATWEWTDRHDQALKDLRESLTSDAVMTYFNPTKHSEVFVDASPVGVAAVLMQPDSSGPNIVSYASRALTEVEKRYSQTEREALAIVFGCEKFHLYVAGSPFTVITDHRPLVSMFNNPFISLPARIERWVLRLQQYNMEVEYRPGRNNPADYASRHPTTITMPDRSRLMNAVYNVRYAETIAEEHINHAAATSTPLAMKLEDIKTATMNDQSLKTVIAAVRSGDKTQVPTPFKANFEELAVTSDGQLLLRGTRIVMPAALTSRAIALAHEGHQGIVKTKQLIRSKTWFPNMDKMVEKTVKSCMACLANTAQHHSPPVVSTPLPASPWTRVACDFYDAPDGLHLLVIVDEFSRYPVVEVVRSLSAKTIIPVFDRIFAMFGVPESMKSDNGPPFNSEDFAKFATALGFHHHRVTPLWPRANGEAEQFMDNIGKTIRAAQTEAKPWLKELTSYLRNYRATPHCTTGVAPATALFGRSL